MKKLFACLLAAMLVLPVFSISTSAATIKFDTTAQFSGTQGENNWYYLFGPAPGQYKEFTNYDATELKWFDNRCPGGELKSDAAHPGGENDANLLQVVYAWKAPSDGKVTFQGDAEKFGQDDANKAWPDGVAIKIYHNNQLLSNTNVAVKEGPDNHTKAAIPAKSVNVKKGDFIYFAVDPKANNAWDFGLVHFTLDLTTAGGSQTNSTAPQSTAQDNSAASETNSEKSETASEAADTASESAGNSGNAAESAGESSDAGTASSALPADNQDGGQSPIVWIVVIAAVLLAGGGAASYFLYFKKR